MTNPVGMNAVVKADATASKERPEVAAVLLQRLQQAMGASWRPGTEAARGVVQSGWTGEETNVRRRDEPVGSGLVAMTTPSPKDTNHALAGERTAQPGIADELLSLLERANVGVYVGDRFGPQQRVLLTLEGALPGAAAEIVRDGAHLVIRLHASNETAYRTMLAQRDALDRTLKEHNLQQVAIELMPVGGVLDARRE